MEAEESEKCSAIMGECNFMEGNLLWLYTDPSLRSG